MTVLDKEGYPVVGLEKSYFTVFDNNKPQEITFFRGQEDEPASVGVVFDASGSMNPVKIKQAKNALSRFMRQGHPENDYFLIGFNSTPQLLADWTRDGQQILSIIDYVKGRRETALYDACYLAVEKIMRGGRPRRALLLISDGQDNLSRFSFEELKRLLRESDVPIYSVGILGGNDPGSSLGMEGQAILRELSEVGGGDSSFPSAPRELGMFLEYIAYELRHQYQLGFKPADTGRDGKWHKIKVKVTLPPGVAPPDLQIAGARTREGYYATKNPR